MPLEKASGYISQLQFNNGQTINVEKDDIVVFVGPNNAGKSQSLKDIYALAKEKTPTTVISDLKTTKQQGSVLAILESIAPAKVSGTTRFYDLHNDQVGYGPHLEDFFFSNSYFGSMRPAMIANLDTAARLNICRPPQAISQSDPKKHPIHYAAFEGKYRRWLSDSFRKAFDEDLIPNTMFGATVPLCMGKPVILDGDYEDEQARQEAYRSILAEYKQVHNQGDGIKSFTGILLYLMLDYYCTYLIDEPESFLHPPQARIMGQIIGETLSDGRQAFISTHSEDIIKGLIEVCPERIKLIRITRDGDVNAFSVLNHEQFSAVWNDPLLRYSNIMSSLFHKTVVLCESDADCRFYSIVESHLQHKAGKYSETLFIHCGGKHRMVKIIKALRAINVTVKLIPDIDVLNDKDVFKGICEAFDIEWSTLDSDY
ncbi:MAG: AAA family ATPase, partial [Clostridia bacterium]|nr:AAA family ATPase [Clostridia bacterium]